MEDNNRNSLRRDPRKAWLRTARGNAKRDGKGFSITLKDIPDIPDTCPVLGIPLSLDSHNKDYVPSLDRIDNSLGYVPGNIILTSRRANRINPYFPGPYGGRANQNPAAPSPAGPQLSWLKLA